MHRLSLHYVLLSLALASLPATARACWEPAASAPGTLSFVAMQAGAPLEGRFRQFDARVCLDPGQAAHIEVTVDTGSVDTMLPELDTLLKGPDFLDTEHWPEATFVSDDIGTLDNNRYTVKGRLTLRDVTRSVALTFRFTPENGDQPARLVGDTTIDRLDYGIGRGEWRDTEWVENQVTIAFSVPVTQVD